MRRTLRGLGAVALVAGLLGPATAGASSHTVVYTYAEVSDGVKIAVSVSFPPGVSPSDTSHSWPALFAMDGYAGGAGSINPANFGNNYIGVYASIRGTGCSGGKFDLFDRRHALDGYEIITDWIPARGWSNGDVGIVGHSYPGLTGFMVAATDPPNLKAIAISGLIDDLYRGIVYPGGVPNFGFPAVWTVGYRPASELSGNAGRYSQADPICLANIATRPPRDVLDDPVLQGATSTTDDAWWASRSLYTYLRGITKPIHLTQQYQDEQTGPRGGHVLFQRIQGVPKRLVLTNGFHSTTAVASADRRAWLDCYVRGVCVGDIADPTKRVRLHFETTSAASPNPAWTTSDWPAPETDWRRYHFRANGSLTTAAPTAGEGTGTSYVSTTEGRHTLPTGGNLFLPGTQAGQVTFANGPDQARFTLDFGGPTAIAGPMTISLWATSTATDTDFFVDVLDLETATGDIQYLQRGMLRASHRGLNVGLSDRVVGGPLGGAIYRPWHPHTSPTNILPLEPVRYEVEVFPVGHVFRAGHKMIVQLHAPPVLDPLSIYAWVSGQPTALNTILHDPANGHTSSILVPVLPVMPSIATTAPPCGAQIGVPCFRPVA